MALELTASWTTDEDELDYLFSGYGCMAKTDRVLKDHLSRSTKQLQEVLKVRQDTAISGAMRWPWSQEALIVSTGCVRVV